MQTNMQWICRTNGILLQNYVAILRSAREYLYQFLCTICTMDPFAALKLNIDKVLELGIKQNEKLTDIQRKVELTSASVARLAKRVDRIEEVSVSSTSGKIPRELSVGLI